MVKVKFVSNIDDFRKALPYNLLDMAVLPKIDELVRLNSMCTGKVSSITHVIAPESYVEIYLTSR